MPGVADDGLDPVRAFYADRDEAGRLAAGEGLVEVRRVRRLLRDRLPAGPARVLDVGGGPGVHAAWLAELGHEVAVVDVVPAHVETARSAGLDARVADARDLGHVRDRTVDVVLLLGPLYHLVAGDDRRQALDEARRVLRDDGLLVATAVTRVGLALHQRRTAADLDPAVSASVERVIAHGRDPEDETPVFHCHRHDEFADELTGAGFHVDRVHGVEGPAWPLLPLDPAPDDPGIDRVVALADALDDDPSVTGASAHLLAFARLAPREGPARLRTAATV